MSQQDAGPAVNARMKSTSEEFSVTTLSENSSLRSESVKQLVSYTLFGANQGIYIYININTTHMYMNLGEWEGVLLRVTLAEV